MHGCLAEGGSRSLRTPGSSKIIRHLGPNPETARPGEDSKANGDITFTYIHSDCAHLDNTESGVGSGKRRQMLQYNVAFQEMRHDMPGGYTYLESVEYASSYRTHLHLHRVMSYVGDTSARSTCRRPCTPR